MIAKGNPHNDGIYLARYLAADSKGNERSELAELKGFASDNIFDAFALGQLMASGTRCQNPFFHVQVRLPAGEALSREQWQQTADLIEMQLGFDDQPRAIVFHLKEGDEHMHLVWSRIDKDTMRAIDPGLYKNKLKEISRILEKDMGLRQISSSRNPDEKTKSASQDEFEESRRLKTDLKDIRETIRECWDRSDNGRSFTAALEEKRLIMARGDERDCVIVDQAGGLHALSKRITGVTAKHVRDRLADIDLKKLPDVDQARAIQREKEKSLMPDQKGLGAEKRKKKALDREEKRKQEAVQKEEDRKREEGEKEEDRKLQAGKDEEQRKENVLKDEQSAIINRMAEEARKREAIREEQNTKAQLKEQNIRAKEIEHLKQTEDIQLRKRFLNYYFYGLDQRKDEARKTGIEEAAAAKELGIRDAGNRYGQALAQHFDMRNPASSLARSAMAEYGDFLRDRENINRQIARATDPMERKAFELQKRIEYAEYMAITSNRIAQQSDIIWGKKVIVEENGKRVAKLISEDGNAQREKAAKYQKEAQELRKDFREVQKTRLMQKEPEKIQPAISKKPEPIIEERVKGENSRKTQPFSEFTKTVRSEQPPQTVTHQDMKQDSSPRSTYFKNVAFEQKRSLSPERNREDLKLGRSLNAADLQKIQKTRPIQEQPETPRKPTSPREPEPMVEERVTGQKEWKTQPLSEFVKTAQSRQPEKDATHEDQKRDPSLRDAYFEGIVFKQRRDSSLEQIREDMKAGRSLDAAALRNLTRDELQKVRHWGHEHLKKIVQEHTRQRDLDRER